MQTEPWLDLFADCSTLDQIWPSPENSATISLLTRFEARDFVHVITTTSTATTGQRVIQYHLPRFRLVFELDEQHTLACHQYAGYHLPHTPSQILHHGLAVPVGLQEFLILKNMDPGIPDRILVPDGTISEDSGSSRLSVLVPVALSTTNVDLQHHSYTINAHTGHLESDVLQSRLFLAALHASRDLRVRLPGLNMTGGEHALHLVRCCHVSRPLSLGEAAALRSIHSFAAHTPALMLACAAISSASNALSFLHKTLSSGPVVPVHSDDIILYRQEVCHAAEGGYVNPRRLLTKQEATQFACATPSEPNHDKFVTWGVIESFLDSQTSQIVQDVACGAFHRRLDRISSRHLSQAASVPSAHLQCMQPGLQRLRGSAHGMEVASMHVESLNAYLASPAPCDMASVNVARLHSELQMLADDVHLAVQVMRTWLLDALACGGDGREGAVLSGMCFAGFVAFPTTSDLIQGTICPGLYQVMLATVVQNWWISFHCSFFLCMYSMLKQYILLSLCTMVPDVCACKAVLSVQALNPHLVDHACEELIKHTLMWQEMCVLQDKLSRCLRLCRPGSAYDTCPSDASLGTLQLELTNRRAWSPAEYPEWLAFELVSGMEIRHRQYVVAKHMLENAGGPGFDEASKGAIVQLNMGEGKTRVILPMLVLAIAGKGHLVRLNFLHELLPEAVEYLHAGLTGMFMLM